MAALDCKEGVPWLVDSVEDGNSVIIASIIKNYSK